MKQKKLTLLLIIFPLSVLLSSWGWVGHQKISLNIELSFTEEMEQFEDWVPFLVSHASDADKRRYSDPSEGAKHYIDLDNYAEFLSKGRIPSTLDSCINAHSEDFVDDNGYLPWATLNTYNCIVESMKHGEWEDAKVAAADLGHYVGDGFMPLHLTRNYNGQYSDNYDIHSRYESDMIGEYQHEISYDGSPVEDIEDIIMYIFSYIYKNYEYMEPILEADNVAREESDGSYNSTYYETLWYETEDFTVELFRGASHAFANLLYNAWREAGKPEINGPAFYISENESYLPDYVGVTYGTSGVVYLVPEDTEKNLADIRSVCLDSISATVNIEVKVPLAGLSNGNYWVYARDDAGKLSGPDIFSLTGVNVPLFTLDGLSVYPNPFVQHSNIKFTLAKEENISVKVIDTQGRIVAVLANGELSPGEHHLIWEGDDISPGIYILRFETGEDVFSRRVLRK